ncbi:MAG: SulP family inorganic anion transporter [Candidatus Gracilibacteria bacterium]
MENTNNKMEKIITFLKNIYQIDGKTYFRKDLIAGITVALIIIPQSMAYAGLAGLPLQVGLYTAFVGVLIGGFLGSSKQMSTGPVTIVSLMTAAALYSMGIESVEGYILYASLLAFFIGVFYLLLVILRLGIIVEFLSHPVVVGFTNAIALVTIISQMSKIFGISIDKSLNFFQGIIAIIITAWSDTHLITFGFGFFGITLLIGLKKYWPKVPRILILLIISIGVSYLIGYETNFGGKVAGDIHKGLPSLSIPFFSHLVKINDYLTIIGSAFIIGLIGFTESIAVAKGVAARTKQKVSTNKELISQAFANMGSGLFGGYGVAGSFSRTAVNLRAGARTGLASIITGIIIGITLMFLTPLLYHLPTAILAAIIIVAVAGLIKIEPIIESWKIQKTDAYVAIITFISTIIFTPNVEIAIGVGVILSLSFYIYKSMKPKVVEVSMYQNGVLRDANFFKLKKSKEVSIIRVDGSIFFANAGHFENETLNIISSKKSLKIVVFDFQWMNNIDSSGFVVLRDLADKLEKGEIKVYFSNLRVKVIEKLHNVKYLENFGRKRIYETVEDVIEFLESKYDKDEINIKPLLKYSPKNKKSHKIGKQEIFKKING